ncbi:MAG: transglutaminase domain-containing protein [Candidatus Omnitrophica bacterium]|nr:transglutaminase domain-containing protein [Candidatus Omnitrophota bacterium]
MRVLLRIFTIFLIAAASVILLSPLISLLFANSSLGRHAYHEVSFQVIAMKELPSSASLEGTIQSAVDYTRSRLGHYFSDSRPYAGKPFDYLVEGVGWCDYQAKVLCKLLAAKGISGRYAFLMVNDDVSSSPHTVAEVYYRGKWGVVDPLHNLIYRNDRGEAVTLEEITAETGSPAYLYPIRHAPVRSDDFLSEKHLFDLIANKYARIFGRAFAVVYQDAYLGMTAPKIKDPAARMLYKARNYHLYGRNEKARLLYRQILSNYPANRFSERAGIFLRELSAT